MPIRCRPRSRMPFAVFTTRQGPADSWAEHQELADAILAGDPEAAGRAARTHVLAARASALARATLPA